MKVWLYYRLSRDEDKELNSLSNQRNIIYHYAITNGHEVVGESFDDNVSGMHFNRAGIDKIYEVVEAGLIEAIVVKDLSRLGRHRTQTALFIDYLREHNVRVLSATENIDTFNEADDLIIGMKAPRGKPSSVCSASEPLVLRPLRHLPHIPASLACERGIPIFFLSSLYIISVKLICPSISVPLYIFLYSFP